MLKGGFKGVSLASRSNKFTAQCSVNGKMKYLGVYSTAELASKAYEDFSKMVHGEFYYALST